MPYVAWIEPGQNGAGKATGEVRVVVYEDGVTAPAIEIRSGYDAMGVDHWIVTSPAAQQKVQRSLAKALVTTLNERDIARGLADKWQKEVERLTGKGGSKVTARAQKSKSERCRGCNRPGRACLILPCLVLEVALSEADREKPAKLRAWARNVGAKIVRRACS